MLEALGPRLLLALSLHPWSRREIWLPGPRSAPLSPASAPFRMIKNTDCAAKKLRLPEAFGQRPQCYAFRLGPVRLGRGGGPTTFHLATMFGEGWAWRDRDPKMLNTESVGPILSCF